MKQKRGCVKFLVLVAFMVVVNYAVYAAPMSKYKVGMALPDLGFQGLTAPQDQEYLGVKGKDAFTLSQISGKLVMVEFLNAF